MLGKLKINIEDKNIIIVELMKKSRDKYNKLEKSYIYDIISTIQLMTEDGLKN